VLGVIYMMAPDGEMPTQFGADEQDGVRATTHVDRANSNVVLAMIRQGEGLRYFMTSVLWVLSRFISGLHV